MNKKHPVTVIRRSCITGKAVWIYQGPSLEAAKKAYQRACKKEIERIRNWNSLLRIRYDKIERLISDCLSRMPVNATLTKQQEEGVRKLKAIQKASVPCNREFYDHIIEEARRRNAASRRWAAERSRKYGI